MQNGILMINSALLTEARQIAVRLKIKDFVGTYSWLQRFKDRNQICYRKTTRMGQKLHPSAKKEAENFKAKIIELCEKYRYPMNAVVNLDESGIFFDAPSGQTLEFRVRVFKLPHFRKICLLIFSRIFFLEM